MGDITALWNRYPHDWELVKYERRLQSVAMGPTTRTLRAMVTRNAGQMRMIRLARNQNPSGWRCQLWATR